MIDFKLFLMGWKHEFHLVILELDTPRFTFTVFSAHTEKGIINTRWFNLTAYPGKQE